MKKTTILDLISRKLVPFMMLFGLYLLTYGHMSPGGGFQGGVVIASGVILLFVAQGVEATASLFPFRSLSLLEAGAFLLLVAAGLAGLAAGAGFLGNPIAGMDVRMVPRASMILVYNVLIGLKVGAGISFMCMYLFREDG